MKAQWKRFRNYGLIALALVCAYIAADTWWHRSGMHNLELHGIPWLGIEPADPFKKPGLGKFLIGMGDKAFVGIEYFYRRLPFRHRKDRAGNRYFAPEYDESLGWAGGFLHCFREPSFFEPPGDPEAPRFRLTIFPRFSKPFCFSISKEADSTDYQLKDITVDPHSAKVTSENTYEIPPESRDRILNLMSGGDFWIPLSEAEDNHMHNRHKGATWVIERDAPHGHQTIRLWSPDLIAIDIETRTREVASGTFRDFRHHAEVFRLLSECTGVDPETRF